MGNWSMGIKRPSSFLNCMIICYNFSFWVCCIIWVWIVGSPLWFFILMTYKHGLSMYHDDLLASLPLSVLYLCWYGSLWSPYQFSVCWHSNRVWRQTLWCHEWIRRAASFIIWNLAGSKEPLLWFVCLLSKHSVVCWGYHGSHLFPCGSKQPFLVLWSVP